MREIPPNVKLLLEIEARQDEVLRELAALDQLIERVLTDCAAFLRLPEGQTLSLSAAQGATAVVSESISAVKVA